jgi:hypothetical protein
MKQLKHILEDFTMKRTSVGLLALACLAAANVASAQIVTTYRPIITDYGYGPVVTPMTSYYPQAAPVVAPLAAPAVSYYAPAPSYVAPTTTYYAPSVAPTTAYYAPAAPVTSYYAPAPVTSYYAPAVVPTTSYYAPTTAYYAPTTAYSAPTTAYYAPTTAYYSPYYTRTKLYVAGEPVRNFFRAVTP